MYNVTALGELLIDFTPAGISENGNVLFERNPGGAPANVLAALARFGAKTAFIGKVGNDRFGSFLKSVLDDINVDTAGLVVSDEFNTTLAFVHLDGKGDRSFSFYRKPGADMMLQDYEINLKLIESADIFHFGSVSMTHEPSRSATIKAVRHARNCGKLISYDPNLRIPLWDDLGEAKKVIAEGLKFADILKISEEEMAFLTGKHDLSEGSGYLCLNYSPKLLFVTLGPRGCFYRMGTNTGILPAYDVKTIDTTGAGDAFLGGILYRLAECGRKPEDYSVSEIEDMIDFANAAGSLATMRKGAIPAMPTLEEVRNCRVNAGKLYS